MTSVVVQSALAAAHSRTFQLEDVNGFGVAAAAQVMLARGERH